MRARYKNKRDQYKAEAQENARLLEVARKRISELEKQPKPPIKDEVKRYSACVYCTNCMTVNDVLVPNGTLLKESDCTQCRVRGSLLPVIKKGMF